MAAPERTQKVNFSYLPQFGSPQTTNELGMVAGMLSAAINESQTAA